MQCFKITQKIRERCLRSFPSKCGHYENLLTLKSAIALRSKSLTAPSPNPQIHMNSRDIIKQKKKWFWFWAYSLPMWFHSECNSILYYARPFCTIIAWPCSLLINIAIKLIKHGSFLWDSTPHGLSFSLQWVKQS